MDWLSLIMKYINLYVDALNIFFFFVFSILYRPYIVCAVCLTKSIELRLGLPKTSSVADLVPYLSLYHFSPLCSQHAWPQVTRLVAGEGMRGML